MFYFVYSSIGLPQLMGSFPAAVGSEQGFDCVAGVRKPGQQGARVAGLGPARSRDGDLRGGAGEHCPRGKYGRSSNMMAQITSFFGYNWSISLGPGGAPPQCSDPHGLV